MHHLTLNQFNQKLKETIGNFSADVCKNCLEPNLTIDAQKWHGMFLGHVSCNVDKLYCKRSLSSEHKDGTVLLLKQLRGEMKLYHNQQIGILRAGDYALVDTTEDVDFIPYLNPISFFSIAIPRMELFSALHNPIRIGAILPSTNTKSRMLNAVLQNDEMDFEPEFLFSLIGVAFQLTEHTGAEKPAFQSETRYLELLDLIDNNLKDPNFCLSALVDKTSMSTRQVQREFEAHGERFSQVLREKRLELSKQILNRYKVEGHTPKIIQISMSCGFGDVSNFYKTFKKKYGCTPSEYVAKPVKNNEDN